MCQVPVPAGTTADADLYHHWSVVGLTGGGPVVTYQGMLQCRGGVTIHHDVVDAPFPPIGVSLQCPQLRDRVEGTDGALQVMGLRQDHDPIVEGDDWVGARVIELAVGLSVLEVTGDA